MSQHLSFARYGKATVGKPRSEPDWGNPTVRDRRGACGNVDHGGTRNPPRTSKERVLETLRLKLCAPQIYPDPLVTYRVTGYTASMITGFKHKGLERFFLRGTKAGIQPRHAARLRLILARLHASTRPQDMNLPGLDLHELKGDRQGTWAVKVSGNWRITFVFRGEDAESVDYEDYH